MLRTLCKGPWTAAQAALMLHALPHRCGLDVYEDEPNVTPGLDHCENVVIVPHIASASLWTRSGMVREIKDRIPGRDCWKTQVISHASLHVVLP